MINSYKIYMRVIFVSVFIITAQLFIVLGSGLNHADVVVYADHKRCAWEQPGGSISLTECATAVPSGSTDPDKCYLVQGYAPGTTTEEIDCDDTRLSDPDHDGATPDASGSSGGSGGTGQSDIDGLLATGVNILIGIAGLAIVGSIIVGGIQYSSAGGNAAQVSSAKNRIVVSIASLIMLGFGYAILQWLVPGGIF